MLKFIVRLPGGKETAFFSQENDVFIGRVSSINDICVNDRSVSRQHAHVKRREEGYTIYDLRSLNGVILNGTRVSRALLKDGDEIRLGEVTIEVRMTSPSQEEELQAIEQSERTAVTPSEDEETTDRSHVQGLDQISKRRRAGKKPKR